MNDILNFLLNNLLFYYVWLPLIVSIAIISTFKNSDKNFIKSLMLFLISYYIARTIILII